MVSENPNENAAHVSETIVEVTLNWQQVMVTFAKNCPPMSILNAGLKPATGPLSVFLEGIEGQTLFNLRDWLHDQGYSYTVRGRFASERLDFDVRRRRLGYNFTFLKPEHSCLFKLAWSATT